MRRTFLVGLVALTVVVGMVTAGIVVTRSVASREAAESGATERDSQVARLDASLFFDNPFEQMAIIDSAVVDHRVTPDGPRCQSVDPYDYQTERGLQQVVAASSLFGFEVGRVLIDCDGSALRLEPGETLATRR